MLRTVLTLAAEPAERFALILSALCQVVAIDGYEREISIVLLIWGRVARIATRFARLAAFGQPKPRIRHPKPQQPKPERPNTPPRTRNPVPCYHGWLARLLPRTRLLADDLIDLLADPDMAEFIANTPSAAKLLRPLLDMLDIKRPTFLQRPPKPRWKAPPGHIPKPRIDPVCNYQPGPRKEELKALCHARFLASRKIRL